MSITLHWWMLPIALILFPFLYRMARPYKYTGGYFGSMDLEGLFLVVVCWVLAIGVCVGRWLA